MTDIIEGKPQGLALDMMQSRSIERFETRIIGTNAYEETAGSDVCVITAGLPRKPGMSRMDLLEVNAKIVGDVTRKLVAGSPDAVIIVVSNPLDEMTALAAQVSRLPKERVMGQAGMLDTARFKHFVAERSVSPPRGRGHHPRLPRRHHGPRPVAGEGRRQAADRVARRRHHRGARHRTRDGGAEIVGLLKTGSAYYAPSSAAAAMVKAVVGHRQVMPGVRVGRGQYGIPTCTSGVPAELGREASRRSSSCPSPTTSSRPCARPPRRCGPSRPTSRTSSERRGASVLAAVRLRLRIELRLPATTIWSKLAIARGAWHPDGDD